MRTTRPPALGAALLALTLLACGEDAATGPTDPGPVPDPDVTAPSVSLASPAPGVELQGRIELRASASDNRGVTGVQFLVDDDPYGTEVRFPPYQISFDSRDLADGPHTVAVRARDAAGNVAASPPIAVAVYNDPGVVQLTIEGHAGLDDADGFQLYVDGTRLRDIPGTGAFTLADVPAGARRLTLGGLPPFCAADEQIVTVRSTTPASAVLTVGCLAEAADGWLLVSRNSGSLLRLSAVSLATGRETVLVPELSGLGAVSPAGTRLAFVDDGTLMIGDLDGFAPVAVAAVPGAREVSWSPDGSALVFSADRGTLPSDLYIVDADGSGLRPLFEAPGHRRRPVWSATGRIAFEMPVGGPMGDITTIWAADADGGNIVQLTFGYYDESPAWSPDGTQLAYSRWTETSSDIDVQVAVVNADGTGTATIREGGAVGYPVWSPDGMWIVHSSTRALRATHVSATPTMAVTGFAAQTLAWVAGGRFD
jgi:hypothetical protein